MSRPVTQRIGQTHRWDGGELSSATSTGLPAPAAEHFGYDGASRLCWVAGSTSSNNCSSPPAGATSYGYDASDNLVQTSDGTTQVFDPAQQLCYSTPAGTAPSTTPPGPGCTLPPDTPANATTFAYDDRGNRVSATPPSADPSEFTYDGENRLTSATVPEAVTNEGEFNPLTTTRTIDTRPGSGFCPNGVCSALSAQQSVSLPVAGLGGVPATGVSAVVVNVTAVAPTAGGYLTAYSTDLSAPPLASTLNFNTGQTIANVAIVKVGSDGAINVFNGAATGSTHLLIDVQGWYSSPSGGSGSTFEPVNPQRLADTRSAFRSGLCPTSTTQCVAIPAGSYREIQVTGQAGVPTTNVSAVAINVTVTNTTTAGHLRVYQAGISVPNSSNLQYSASDTRAELAVTKVSTSGRIRIYNGAATGNVDVFVDVQGWHTAASDGSQETFTPTTPARVLNTVGTGKYQNGSTHTIDLPTFGEGAAPPDASAVVINVTAVAPTSAGWLVVWGTGVAQPGTSNVNFASGSDTANAALVKLNGTNQLDIYVADAATDVIIDVLGYYTTRDDRTTYDYTYSSDGLRKAKSSKHGTTTYTWDLSSGLPSLLGEDTAGASTYWIYGPHGLPVSQINSDGSTYYLHHDQLGSTRLVTDTNGNAVSTMTYEAYGKLAGATGGIVTPMGYAGQYTDPETGFQYLRARYYDPTTGQFLTRDPIEAITREPYGYVYGNPLNATDPSGLAPWDGYCIMGVNCGEGATHAIATPQDAADYAGGTFDALFLGQGHRITDALPFTRGKVHDSGWNTGGQVVGTLPWLAAPVSSWSAGRAARLAYVDDAAAISQRGCAIGGQAGAEYAVGARNALKASSRQGLPSPLRGLLEARNRSIYGNGLGPSVEQLSAAGKTYEQMIASSGRTNPWINRFFGV